MEAPHQLCEAVICWGKIGGLKESQSFFLIAGGGAGRRENFAKGSQSFTEAAVYPGLATLVRCCVWMSACVSSAFPFIFLIFISSYLID